MTEPNLDATVAFLGETQKPPPSLMTTVSGAESTSALTSAIPNSNSASDSISPLQKLKKAVHKLHMIRALAKVSMLHQGVSVFVNRAKLPTTKDPSNLPFPEKWALGTITSVLKAAAESGSSVPVTEVSADTNLQDIRCIVTLTDTNEVVDITNVSEQLHYNKGCGWSPGIDDFTAIRDCHESTLALSFKNFCLGVASTRAPRAVVVAGNEAAIVGGPQFQFATFSEDIQAGSKKLDPLNNAALSQHALMTNLLQDRSLLVLMNDTSQYELLNCIFTSKMEMKVSNPKNKSNALHNFQHYMQLLQWIGGAKALVEVSYYTNEELTVRPYFWESSSAHCYKLFPKSSSGVKKSGGVPGHIDTIFQALEMPPNHVDQITKIISACRQLVNFSMSPTGLRGAQTDELNTLAGEFGVLPKTFTSHFYPKTTTTAPLLEEAKLSILQASIAKIVSFCFKSSVARSSSNPVLFRLLSVPHQDSESSGGGSGTSPALTTPSSPFGSVSSSTTFGQDHPTLYLENFLRNLFYDSLSTYWMERVHGMTLKKQHQMEQLEGTEVAGSLENQNNATTGAQQQLRLDQVQENALWKAQAEALQATLPIIESNIMSSSEMLVGKIVEVNKQVTDALSPSASNAKKPPTPPPSSSTTSSGSLISKGTSKERDCIFVAHPSMVHCHQNVTTKYNPSKWLSFLRGQLLLPHSPASFLSQFQDLCSKYLKAPFSCIHFLTPEDWKLGNVATAMEIVKVLHPVHCHAIKIEEFSAFRSLIYQGERDNKRNNAAVGGSTQQLEKMAFEILGTSLGIPKLHFSVQRGVVNLSSFAKMTLYSKFMKRKGTPLLRIATVLRARYSEKLGRKREMQRHLNVLRAFVLWKRTNVHLADVEERYVENLIEELRYAQQHRILVTESSQRDHLEWEEDQQLLYLLKQSGSFLGPLFLRIQFDLVLLEMRKRQALVNSEIDALKDLLDWFEEHYETSTKRRERLLNEQKKRTRKLSEPLVSEEVFARGNLEYRERSGWNEILRNFLDRLKYLQEMWKFQQTKQKRRKWAENVVFHQLEDLIEEHREEEREAQKSLYRGAKQPYRVHYDVYWGTSPQITDATVTRQLLSGGGGGSRSPNRLFSEGNSPNFNSASPFQQQRPTSTTSSSNSQAQQHRYSAGGITLTTPSSTPTARPLTERQPSQRKKERVSVQAGGTAWSPYGIGATPKSYSSQPQPRPGYSHEINYGEAI